MRQHRSGGSCLNISGGKPLQIIHLNSEKPGIMVVCRKKWAPAACEERKITMAVSVLIVEDDRNIAELLQMYLEKEGYAVTCASDGGQGLAKYRAIKPDLVLLDVMMPVMDGYEAARAIRNLKREDTEKIPIIAMTANAFAEDVKAAMDAGMNEHLTKPLAPEVIDRVLRDWLAVEK